MDYITLDFETAYRSKVNAGTPGPKYSLETMTYEEYIFHDLFKLHGVGIKVNNQTTVYYRGQALEDTLKEIFSKPVILICHNTVFDGAILCWKYGLTAAKYYCTQAMSRALWPQAKASLKHLAIRLFPNDESKRKTDELESVDGIWDMTPEQETAIEGYCINDVDLTFDCFAEMWKYFPEDEFEVMHKTLRMFIEPLLELNEGLLEDYLVELKETQAHHVETVAEKEQLLDAVFQASKECMDWVENQPFDLGNPLPFIEETLRSWKHVNRFAIRKPRKKDTDEIREWMAHLDKAWTEDKDTTPLPFTFMAARLVAEFDQNALGISRKLLSSNEVFAMYITWRYGIKVKRKLSPTPKNPNNTTWALAKDDLEFLDIQKEYQAQDYLWQARLNLSSTIEQSRAQRLLDHYRLNGKRLAVPLNYYGALTGRWSGTNKVNFQNFGRSSPIRHALVPPDGFIMAAPDLSNIESRVLAWFTGCTELNESYAAGRDIYSEFASDAYDRPVDRKRKARDKEGNYLDKHGQIVEKDKAHTPDYIEGMVGKTCILGLGYGMGWATLQNTFAKGALGAPQLFFSDEFCKRLTNDLYRKKYPEIPAAWDEAQRVIADMAKPNLQPYAWGCLLIESGRIKLPNGLYLTYPRLKQVEHPDSNRPEYVYWNGKFWKKLYGGLLIENIIQALSRILMAIMLVKIDDMLQPYGGRVVLTVHDEVVFIVPREHGPATLKKALAVMRIPLRWCSDGSLTLEAEGDLLEHYQK